MELKILSDEQMEKIVDNMPERGEEKTMAIEITLIKAQAKETAGQIQGELIARTSFTVKVEGNSVTVDRYDWERLINWIMELKEVSNE